jgi:hypothetical protein
VDCTAASGGASNADTSDPPPSWEDGPTAAGPPDADLSSVLEYTILIHVYTEHEGLLWNIHIDTWY